MKKKEVVVVLEEKELLGEREGQSKGHWPGLTEIARVMVAAGLERGREGERRRGMKLGSERERKWERE